MTTPAKTAKAKVPLTASGKLMQSLEAAVALGDSKGDQAGAALLLDRTLARNDSAPLRERVPLLVYRAELAIAMNDIASAAKRLGELKKLPLSAADRAALAAEPHFRHLPEQPDQIECSSATSASEPQLILKNDLK